MQIVYDTRIAFPQPSAAAIPGQLASTGIYASAVRIILSDIPDTSAALALRVAPTFRRIPPPPNVKPGYHHFG